MASPMPTPMRAAASATKLRATLHREVVLDDRDWPYRRFAHYNVWRVLTAPPQNIPLAVCDAGSLRREDLIPAIAMFDFAGVPARTTESFVLRFNRAHRWHYFRDTTPQEALIFVTHEGDPQRPHHVPRTAFDHPTCPVNAAPRSSIEIRVAEVDGSDTRQALIACFTLP